MLLIDPIEKLDLFFCANMSIKQSVFLYNAMLFCF